MTDQFAQTTLHVSGVRTEADVVRALQALYDVFTPIGVGGATFEVTDTPVATLLLKHKESVVPDVTAIDAALSSAGDYHVVD